MFTKGTLLTCKVHRYMKMCFVVLPAIFVHPISSSADTTHSPFLLLDIFFWAPWEVISTQVLSITASTAVLSSNPRLEQPAGHME